jgi:glycerol-3-phosphate dehydrogenase subunit C
VALTQGDPDAEKMMHDNLMLLKPYIEDGWEVIASSSSCSLTLKQDYRKRASEALEWYLSGKVYDLHEYLFQLKEKGEFSMDFTAMHCKLAFHAPCHLTVQSKKNFVHEVLKLIPGVTLCKFEDSCCGIAGSYGFKKKNYQTSMNIGTKLFNSLQSANPDYVLTSCGTCKIQLEQGLKKRVFHTSELLASSYKGELLPGR